MQKSAEGRAKDRKKQFKNIPKFYNLKKLLNPLKTAKNQLINYCSKFKADNSNTNFI